MTDEANDARTSPAAAEDAQALALAGHLMVEHERERGALARTLHDEFGSNLTAINLDLASVAAQLPDGVARKRLERAMAVLKETVELKRRLIQMLRPGMIDTLGLAATLRVETEAFGARLGIRCSISLCEDPPDLAPEPAMALYRVVQARFEQLARAASATQLELKLDADTDYIMLVIEDDGVFTDDADPLETLALQAHLQCLEGRFTLLASGRGSRLDAGVPLAAAPPRA